MIKRLKIFYSFFIFIGIVFIFSGISIPSCMKNQGPLPILSTHPNNNEINVPVNTTVKIFFELGKLEKVQKYSEASIRMDYKDSLESVSFDKNISKDIIYIVPRSPLKENTRIIVTVSIGLYEDYVFDFTTIAQEGSVYLPAQ